MKLAIMMWFRKEKMKTQFIIIVSFKPFHPQCPIIDFLVLSQIIKKKKKKVKPNQSKQTKLKQSKPT